MECTKCSASGKLDLPGHPWLHKDPWGSQASSVPTKLHPQQLAELEQSLEKKFAKQASSDERMEVDADRRVSELEAKVGQIAQDFAAYQIHNNKQQQGLQNQIANIDAKVDSHQQAIHTLLDTKLESQMSRIEQLFAKRARTAHE